MSRYRTASGSGPDPPLTLRAAFATDERGMVRRWSEEACLLLGYRAEEVVGRSAADLLGQRVIDEAGESLDNGRPRWIGTARPPHQDGHGVEVRLLAHRGGGDEEGMEIEWVLSSVVRQEPGPGADEDGTPWADAFLQSPYAMAVFDSDLLVLRANAGMGRIADLADDLIQGLRPSDFMMHGSGEGVENAMREALKTGEERTVETRVRTPEDGREHVWLASLAPVRNGAGEVYGVCLAMHDMTAHHRARQRLQLVNQAGSRIGSTLDITRTAQELADVAVPELADYASVDLLTFIEDGDEPSPGPLSGSVTMRRTAVRSVSGALPGLLRPGDTSVYPMSSPAAESLVTGRSEMYEMTDADAIAAWSAHDPNRIARMRLIGVHSAMVVPMRARGVTLGVANFARGARPEPFEQGDILLAEEITARAAVCIDNARRYARERTTAVTLQRSLLPQRLPDQAALDLACRYLPTGGGAGVGGDWFDVIPLSGARVALVVGDVVGHGIRASATMGRLRSTVRTLADVDLPPDELLTHLDDVVMRMGDEAGAEADVETVGEIGATCLYAVYDPVSGHCSLASAGHLPPVVVTPGHTADLLRLPVGPPLGLGGLPFETAEADLPEGSLLALYTDGLVELRDRDIDDRLDMLCRAVARPAESLDGLCDAVLGAMHPAGRPQDDIVLLVARTRSLSKRQVASWDLPADPAVVARARMYASEQLAAWGLDELVFAVELVVSELVTNAIRYGQPPIRLRLVHDRDLSCEVFDGSSTTPRLRRARAFDEGGRGLLLVAQLSQRWGTRYASSGKTIWAQLAPLAD